MDSKPSDHADAGCSALSDLEKNDVSIRWRRVAATQQAPEHCELIARIPAETAVYVGLPDAWNGQIWMMGNGGFAGGDVGPAIDGAHDHTAEYRQTAAASAMRAGFVAVYTNGGHYGGSPFDGSFAYGRPDLLEDLAHRSVHEGIVLAKKAAKARYGKEARFSYFEGCSTGGRQGLMAAARYPDDFDGIVANAPVVQWSHLMVKARWNQIALDAAPGLDRKKMSAAFDLVLKHCDGIDGVEDRLIGDPRQCDFDPAIHLPSCDAGEEKSCFTAAEKKALADIHRGPPIDGEHSLPQYWDTLAPETTSRWLVNADGSPTALTIMAQSFFKYAAFLPEQDPRYDWRSFDFVRDPARMRAFDALMNPGTELDAFRRRGGKILGFWGWSDASVNPAMGIAYHKALTKSLGTEAVRDFYRQFFIPGVGNCSGGHGPDKINVMQPLTEWVEAGQPPGRLSARRIEDGKIIYSRAYCAFPLATVYRGGDPEDIDNWQCSAE